MSVNHNTEFLQKYVDYLERTGGVPVGVFDSDWEPIGPIIRMDLRRYGLAVEENGMILKCRPAAETMYKSFY